MQIQSYSDWSFVVEIISLLIKTVRIFSCCSLQVTHEENWAMRRELSLLHLSNTLSPQIRSRWKNERVRISIVLLNYKKGYGNVSFLSVSIKGWRMHFMAVKKSVKRPGDIHMVHLQMLKGVQSCNLGMWKGSHLPIEGEAFTKELLLTTPRIHQYQWNYEEPSKRPDFFSWLVSYDKGK